MYGGLFPRGARQANALAEECVRQLNTRARVLYTLIVTSPVIGAVGLSLIRNELAPSERIRSILNPR